jgi:hypothetical protein
VAHPIAVANHAEPAHALPLLECRIHDCRLR